MSFQLIEKKTSECNVKSLFLKKFNRCTSEEKDEVYARLKHEKNELINKRFKIVGGKKRPNPYSNLNNSQSGDCENYGINKYFTSKDPI